MITKAHYFRATFVALCLVLIQACGQGEPPVPPSIAAGSDAPSWSGSDLLTGSTIDFPEVLDGKPAVLVFWATWCPYCKAFMPYAKRIQDDYAQYGVQALSFNAKERGQGDPKAYIQSLDFAHVSIADADAIAAMYDVKFIPGLMVVNGKGKVIYRRGWTELPAGRKVAEQWDSEVRVALDAELGLAESDKDAS
jgi:thiol-disulfide isomerase/thioredoxin